MTTRRDKLAAKVAQENDPQKLIELTDELLLAMEEEKRQSDLRLRRSARPLLARLRSEVEALK